MGKRSNSSVIYLHGNSARPRHGAVPTFHWDDDDPQRWAWKPLCVYKCFVIFSLCFFSVWSFAFSFFFSHLLPRSSRLSFVLLPLYTMQMVWVLMRARVCLRALGKDVLAAATVTRSRLNYTRVAQIECDKVKTESGWQQSTRAREASQSSQHFKTRKSFWIRLSRCTTTVRKERSKKKESWNLSCVVMCQALAAQSLPRLNTGAKRSSKTNKLNISEKMFL